MTRDVMIEAMKNGATGTDATIIANKVTVGLAYADAGLEGDDFSLASVTEVASTVTAANVEVATLAYEAAVAAAETIANNPNSTIAELNAANAAAAAAAVAAAVAEEEAAAAAAEAADVAKGLDSAWEREREMGKARKNLIGKNNSNLHLTIPNLAVTETNVNLTMTKCVQCAENIVQ